MWCFCFNGILFWKHAYHGSFWFLSIYSVPPLSSIDPTIFLLSLVHPWLNVFVLALLLWIFSSFPAPAPPPPPSLSLSLSLSLSYLQSIHVLPASLFTHFCSIYIHVVFFYIFPEYDIVNFHTGTKIDIQEGRLHTKQMANVVVGSSPGMHTSGMGEVFFFFFFFFNHSCTVTIVFWKKCLSTSTRFFIFIFIFIDWQRSKRTWWWKGKRLKLGGEF